MSDEKQTPETVAARARRLALRTAAIGAALAVFCHLLPPDYRDLCNTVAAVCAGGIK